jgi:hypothetical protein
MSVGYKDDQLENQSSQGDDIFDSHPDLQDLARKHQAEHEAADFSDWENEFGDGDEDIPPKPKTELNESGLASAESDAEDTDDDEEYDWGHKLNENPTSGEDFFIPTKKKQKADVSTKRIMLILGGIFGGFSMFFIVFIMFMSMHRLEHLRNLVVDYRFARFHRQIAKRIKNNFVISEGLSAESPVKMLEFEKTSLYKRVRGYSPEKTFGDIGKAGMELEVSKSGVFGTGEHRITAFTDPVTGEKVYSSRAKSIPEGGKVLDTKAFADHLTNTATSALESAGHTKFSLKNSRKMLQEKSGIKFGDKMKAFADKFKAKATELKLENADDLTPDQVSEVVHDVDVTLATETAGHPKGTGSMEELLETSIDDLKTGAAEPTIADFTPPENLVPRTVAKPLKPLGKTATKLKSASNAYSEYSAAVFAATMGCIVHDLSGTIVSSLQKRPDLPAGNAARIIGEAEQEKSGNNVSLDLVKERNKQFEGSEDSEAYSRLVGESQDKIDAGLPFDPVDLPFKFMGLNLRNVSNIANAVNTAFTPLGGIPVIGDAQKAIVNGACSKILDPRVQIAVAGLDLAALVISIGTTGIAEQSIMKVVTLSAKAAAQIGVGVGLNKLLFEYLVPRMLLSMAGSGGVFNNDGARNFGLFDMGTEILANTKGKYEGSSRISPSQANSDRISALNDIRNQRLQTEGAWAYFNPSNPYSMTTQFALSLPSTPMAAANTLFKRSVTTAASMKTFRQIGNMFSGKALAADEATAEAETYGVPQYGIPSALEDEDMVTNALIVDGEPGKLDKLLADNHQCFDTSLADQELNGLFGGSERDFSHCDSEEVQRLGLYLVDHCVASFTSTDTNANNCSPLAGAGDVVGN